MSSDDKNWQHLLARATAYVRDMNPVVPQSAIILGSGLGGLADQIAHPTAIPYADIPGFATSTASGHRGQLIVGELGRHRVVAMAGRLHRYEGWSNDDIAFPVHLMASLGATRLIVSNAAGGLHPKLRVGDLVVIRDHINLIGGVCHAITPRLNLGPMHRGDLYDPPMSRAAMAQAVRGRFNAYEGTYLATLGPNYETRSEYRMMRRIGADVAGMSTVPEVLVAASLEMRILGISMVSNVARPDRPGKTDHREVLEAGRAAAVKMESMVRAALDCP
jgi:purine-nucleoside phosphorylase